MSRKAASHEKARRTASASHSVLEWRRESCVQACGQCVSLFRVSEPDSTRCHNTASDLPSHRNDARHPPKSTCHTDTQWLLAYTTHNAEVGLARDHPTPAVEEHDSISSDAHGSLCHHHVRPWILSNCWTGFGDWTLGAQCYHSPRTAPHRQYLRHPRSQSLTETNTRSCAPDPCFQAPRRLESLPHNLRRCRSDAQSCAVQQQRQKQGTD